MNKENKKMAQERRAREREKQEQKKKMKDFLGLWGPIALIAVVVIVLIVAIVTSGMDDDDYDYADDDESSFVYVDEDGNEIVFSEVTEGDDDELDTTAGQVVEMGDIVNIDYVGKIDGVAFEGGDTMGQGADLEIGSGTYIDGFEDAIIGHKVGETFDLTVTFPDPYMGNPDLSGKEAVFTTTINGIY